MINYLRNNLLLGFKASPVNSMKFSLFSASLFGCAAFFVGANSGLFKYEIIESKLAFILPFTLFLFPSLLEESFFRGVLIPNGAKEKGIKFIIGITLMSSLLFVIWHPLNAFTVNTGAQALFSNVSFLFIVFFLGVVCSLSYIFSKSLWVPIIIHWLTVFVWVFFLGGRNMVLGQ